MPEQPTPGHRHGGPAAGVPAGTRLVIAPGTRRLAPALVAGGRPWRLLRLTAAGDRWIDRWSVGQAVPEPAGVRRLATRLVDAGLAWSRPPPDRDVPVTVVVPCRDRAAGLAATLDALEPDLDVVVVDDGSAAPEAVARIVAGRPRTHLVRRARSGGPGAARNDGWRRLLDGGDRDPDPRGRAGDGDGDQTGGREPGREDRRLVAFLDTECIPSPGWVAALAGHFGDPDVGAAAPRIHPAPTPGAAGWLHRYEQARSPLDLGALPAPVRPRSIVPYVPSAALVVRLAALADIDGFDEQLSTGEDVDFVWRLDRAGWRVRYDPAVEVTHPVRPHLQAWAAQRVGYGRAAAPLASRHGSAVAPLVISRSAAAAWALVAAGHPVAGAIVAVVSSARLAANPGQAGGSGGGGAWPRTEIARLALKAHLHAGLGIADAVRRAWWPLAVVTAVACRRARPALAAVVIVPPLMQWHEIRRHQHRPPLGRTAWVTLRLADDVAYGTGVWAGAWRERRARCLRPDLV